MSKLLLGLMLAGMTSTFNHLQNDPTKDVLGMWFSENKRQKIEVYWNYQTGKYCGRIAWMAEDDPTAGTQMLDNNNPNPSLRTRRITGTDMLHDFYYSGSGGYFYGYIYDPTSGSDYKCRIILSEDGKTATIRGYVLLPMFGRTEVCSKAY